jgi:anti-sigma B factor antagonist
MATRDCAARTDSAPDEHNPSSPQRTPFGIELKPDRERVLVCVSGEVDLATAHQLKESVAELLDSGFKRLVVDLRRVTFLDSSGIDALLTCDRAAAQHDAIMQVALGDARTRRTLEITGAIDYLNLVIQP